MFDEGPSGRGYGYDLAGSEDMGKLLNLSLDFFLKDDRILNEMQINLKIYVIKYLKCKNYSIH